MYKPHVPTSDCHLPADCLLVKMYVDIYLQTEEAPVVSCGNSGRRLKPLTRLPQQIAQRPDGGDGDRARAAGQNQHAVAPPAHVHQRMVLLLIWGGSQGQDETIQRYRSQSFREATQEMHHIFITTSKTYDHTPIRHNTMTLIVSSSWSQECMRQLLQWSQSAESWE